MSRRDAIHAAPMLRPVPAAPQAQRTAASRPTPAAPAFDPLPQGSGRALPPALRADMENRFATDFGRVRVHDGPAAAVQAERLQARAFAAGQNIVFGPGQFRPEDPAGRGLIAHELAHVLQQRGAHGPAAMPTSGERAALEAEADQATEAIAGGGTARIGQRTRRPVVLRSGKKAAAPPPVPAQPPASAPGTGAAPASAAAQPATTAAPAQRLPPGLKVITDDPNGIGTTELVVEVTAFALPLEKGAGSWVQKAYDDAAAGGRLVFTPLFTGKSVAAWKEGSEDYKSIWLGQFGFKTTAEVANAFKAAAATNEEVKTALADPTVKATVTGLGQSLTSAKCDIDHIVEKQMGGTSIPSNLQLLVSSKNQASGRETYQELVRIVDAIRDPAMRGDKVNKLQLRLAKASVPAGTSDPSFVIEALLRKGAVKGSDAVKAAADGKPVSLVAGGQGETVNLRDTGETPLDSLSKRIVPGMRLQSYKRGAGGAKSKVDTVIGELDSRAISKSGSGKSAVTLTAEIAAAAAPVAANPTTPDPAASPAAAPVAEGRTLKLDKTKNKAIAFYYPYLSAGELTKLDLDEQGNLMGEGTLTPTVPIFPKLVIRYAKDELSVVAPIPAAKLVSPLPGAFRFTDGEIALQLSPSLVPKGRVGFSVGPAAKPVVNGDLSVRLEGGVVIAEGKLTPAGKLPGVSAAEGTVRWTSDTGWSGKLTASTASLPKSTANVEIGFTTKGGAFSPYASGGITTTIGSATLQMGASWAGQGLSYKGGVTVTKPLPLVDEVRLSGRYGDNGIWLDGEAGITWKNIKATMKVGYARKEEEEEGRFSGTATVAIKTEKADGSVTLNFDQEGRYWGKGTVAYQVTKSLRPTLGIELTPDRRMKLSGEVTVGDIALTRMWPSPEGGKVDIIKGLGVKFSIPTPVPAVTAYGEIRGSLGLGYGVGPVMLKGVVFKGELYPLEDDPKVKAHLTGVFAVPAYGELYGTFGAYIGLEVALGAVGAKGGIEITPKLRIEGEGGIKVDADYDQDGFSFEAEAYAKGRLVASARVDLVADLYAAWGLLSHIWTYNVASVSAQIGPELKLSLGKIAYAKSGEVTWPSLSQIKADPENIDPMSVVRDMLGRGEAKEK
jgi:hypothetical protein